MRTCARLGKRVSSAGAQFLVEAGVAVLDYGEAVVGIGGFAEGGEHAAAGGDAEHDERFDGVAAEDHFEVDASGKSSKEICLCPTL